MVAEQLQRRGDLRHDFVKHDEINIVRRPLLLQRPLKGQAAEQRIRHPLDFIHLVADIAARLLHSRPDVRLGHIGPRSDQHGIGNIADYGVGEQHQQQIRNHRLIGKRHISLHSNSIPPGTESYVL
ncbi:hypothetical protein D3C81_1830950 [compost metagenome]